MLFISTTSAFGKSSIYNRLKIGEQKIAEKLGYTQGFGSFQISDELYKGLIEYLAAIGEDVSRSYGDGPSRKMKLIRLACQKLGLSNYTYHGIKREYYIFPFAKNVKQAISREEEPDWLNLSFNQLVEFWRRRWLEKRLQTNQEWTQFSKEDFLNTILPILEGIKDD